MLIVTAGSGNHAYWKTIRYNEMKCKEFRYSIKVYDLGGLGFGTLVNDPRCKSKFRTIRATLKPEIILDTLKNTVEEHIVWIDGDATLIKPINEIEVDVSFDVGLTVRPKVKIKKTQYINTGVVFLKNNENAKRFVEKWIEAIPPAPSMDITKKPKGHAEQAFLEEKVLLPNIDVVPWDAFFTVHEVHGIKVKFFDCERYNNFWGPKHMQPPAVDTKIIHFKGHGMKRLDRYVEKFLND